MYYVDIVNPASPHAALFRQALHLPDDALITVTAATPMAPSTLLFEIWDADKPGRPQKRYLYCNDPREPGRVSAVTHTKARQLAGMLSHSEILISILDATTAIAEYERLEADYPSRETVTNGHCRQYQPAILD